MVDQANQHDPLAAGFIVVTANIGRWPNGLAPPACLRAVTMSERAGARLGIGRIKTPPEFGMILAAHRLIGDFGNQLVNRLAQARPTLRRVDATAGGELLPQDLHERHWSRHSVAYGCGTGARQQTVRVLAIRKKSKPERAPWG